MKKSYAPHLLIIRDSIAAIERYRPTDKAAFLADTLAQDAILMRIQVIGEHLAGMRKIDVSRFTEVADDTWYQVIGLRNIISHGYETINFERIWRIVADELPELSGSLAVLDDA
jgi:uncharacterized protein with HEPN domain